ncbi:hypothetical protein AAFN60_18795 [Roseibacillus persicicus]|uniref:hypothetical protein n=1 Tax=Roseibacillus persicicus TaxID=454148 RepID=UPI00398AF5EB
MNLIGRWTRDLAQGIADGVAEVKNSLRRMKFKSWLRMAVQAPLAYHQFQAAMLSSATSALLDWYDGLLERIYDQSQDTLYSSIPWAPAQNYLQTATAFNYAFGYGMGYIAEQVFLGKGIKAAGKALAKLGSQVAISSLTAAKRVAPRMAPLFTKYTASARLTAQEFTWYLDNLRFIYTHPLGTPIPASPGATPVLSQSTRVKPVSEAFEEAAELAGSSAGKTTGEASKKFLDDLIDSSPNIKNNATTIRLFHQRLSQLKTILDTRFTDEVAENFTRIYDRKILSNPANAEDWFENFVKAFHSKGAGPNFPIDTIDDDAKSILEAFRKAPNAGNPWAIGFNTNLPAPRRHFTRGNLIELDAAKNGRYKTWDYLDEINEGPTEAVDFRQNGVWVQQTSSTSNSDITLGNLEDKLEAIVNHAVSQNPKGTKAILDIDVRENFNHDYSFLDDLAEDLADSNGIIVEVKITEIPFAGWGN